MTETERIKISKKNFQQHKIKTDQKYKKVMNKKSFMW